MSNEMMISTPKKEFSSFESALRQNVKINLN